MYGTSKLYNVLAVKEIQKRIGSPQGALASELYKWCYPLKALHAKQRALITTSMHMSSASNGRTD